MLEPDGSGRRSRFRFRVITPNVSRYRFVYPHFTESTATANERNVELWIKEP